MIPARLMPEQRHKTTVCLREVRLPSGCWVMLKHNRYCSLVYTVDLIV